MVRVLSEAARSTRREVYSQVARQEDLSICEDGSADRGGCDPLLQTTARPSSDFRHVRIALPLMVSVLAAGTLAAMVSGGAWARGRRRGGGLRSSDSLVLLDETAEEDCHTAKHGERCHTDVVYAMRYRMLHPEWYIGLTNCSSFGNFQAFMHTQVLNSGERRCPLPCSDAHEIGHVGEDCAEEETQQKDCHTAVPGDECYAHVLYTQKEAIKYPRWYPGLTADSSIAEVQHYLKEENVCPEPCELVPKKNLSEKLEGCHTALPGDTCFGDIMQAKEQFIEKHPEWYPGLTNASSRDEFQAFLHAQRHVDAEAAEKACPNPCNEQALDEIKLRATCRTAEAGDDCFESVLWGATKGIQQHPEWYKGLQDNSSFEEFQMHLHADNHTKCVHAPCPCHTARFGEECYWSIMWVFREGIHKYPKTFKGLTNESSLEEVQLVLHNDRTNTCGRPCTSFDADERSPWKKTYLEESKSVI
eukprot:CAMPEP_0171181718 /NCGR_PEP_ID=MMETSP0790-20130122/14401_1 /TAXON_ID=2925 /ORGANISM="Alexandrium catenella, Strain OF101" /LENGTH=473 /DNA_ID=CAMNT_0011646659 /DNA_START=32 /DNA_END=1453 /DNA_ORIENTATION=-